MAETTLRKMAAGGMYDHLGGGFHRYSVDEHWHVPHFEKVHPLLCMLLCPSHPLTASRLCPGSHCAQLTVVVQLSCQALMLSQSHGDARCDCALTSLCLLRLQMLYDNGQLAQTYLDAFSLTGNAAYARVARGILDYLHRDMTHPDGGIFSAEVPVASLI